MGVPLFPTLELVSLKQSSFCKIEEKVSSLPLTRQGKKRHSENISSKARKIKLYRNIAGGTLTLG